MTDVLFCVGNSMMSNDGAGLLLAEECAVVPRGDWVMIDGGSAPENDIATTHELRPTRPLIVDATDMGLDPGETRTIDPTDVAEMFMMTIHSMPLNYFTDQLKEDVDGVVFLGIQPDIIGFRYPITQSIKDVVETVYQRLEGWEGNGGFVQSAMEEEQFSVKEFRESNIGAGMCTSLLSLALPIQVISSTEYLPVSDSEHA